MSFIICVIMLDTSDVSHVRLFGWRNGKCDLGSVPGVVWSPGCEGWYRSSFRWNQCKHPRPHHTEPGGGTHAATINGLTRFFCGTDQGAKGKGCSLSYQWRAQMFGRAGALPGILRAKIRRSTGLPTVARESTCRTAEQSSPPHHLSLHNRSSDASFCNLVNQVSFTLFIDTVPSGCNFVGSSLLLSPKAWRISDSRLYSTPWAVVPPCWPTVFQRSEFVSSPPCRWCFGSATLGCRSARSAVVLWQKTSVVCAG